MGDVVWEKTRPLSTAIKGITEKFCPSYRKAKIVRVIGSNSYEVAKDYFAESLHAKLCYLN